MRSTLIVFASVVLACSGDEHESRPAPIKHTKVAPPTEDMVPIAPGKFIGARTICQPGSMSPQFDPILDSEQRDTTIMGSAFSIDRRVATCAQVVACEAAGECKGTHLCNEGVAVATLDVAQQYCHWRNARLPSFAEWQRAARFTDGRLFPTGKEWNTDACHWVDQMVPDTDLKSDKACEVASPDGMIYTVMNVDEFEWTGDMDCFRVGREEYRPVPVRVSLVTPFLSNELLRKFGTQGEFRCVRIQ